MEANEIIWEYFLKEVNHTITAWQIKYYNAVESVKNDVREVVDGSIEAFWRGMDAAVDFADNTVQVVRDSLLILHILMEGVWLILSAVTCILIRGVGYKMERKGMNMNQNEGSERFAIIYFLGLLIIFVANFIPYYKRRRLYKTDPKTSESRERMKFITKYSPDEIVWKLRCHGAGDAIGYEVKKETDAVLLLTVKGVQGSFSRNTVEREARYKIAIKQEGEHTAIWVFLLEYSDEYVKDRYGWEMKGFLIKKLDAENVEFDLGKKEPER